MWTIERVYKMMEKSNIITSLINKYDSQLTDPRFDPLMGSTEQFIEHAFMNLQRIDVTIRKEEHDSYLRCQEQMEKERNEQTELRSLPDQKDKNKKKKEYHIGIDYRVKK